MTHPKLYDNCLEAIIKNDEASGGVTSGAGVNNRYYFLELLIEMSSLTLRQDKSNFSKDIPRFFGILPPSRLNDHGKDYEPATRKKRLLENIQYQFSLHKI